MSAWLLAATGTAYVYVAFTYWQAGRHGIALAFAAYAVSNLGFMWDLWYGRSL